MERREVRDRGTCAFEMREDIESPEERKIRDPSG